MRSGAALKIFEKIKRFYNERAEEFARTREKIWPELQLFTRRVRAGERILDLGCGAGRLLEFFREQRIEYIGADISEKMLAIARQKYSAHQFVLLNDFHLPWPAEHFDWIFCVAVFHHIPGSDYRLEFLREAKRVLKKGGRLFLTVWKSKSFSWVLVKYTLFKLLGLSPLDFKDVFYPWQKEKQARYFHLFSRRELKKILARADLAAEEIGVLRRSDNNFNLYVLARKD